MKVRVALLVVASTLGGCSRQPAGVADEVRKQALGVVAAYNAQDAHKAASYDASDYVGVYHGTPNTIGAAADEASMKAGMAAAKVVWQLGEGKVTVAKDGDLGIFEAPYTFVMTTPVSIARESGTWIAIFKRQSDGSMKLWRSIASDGAGPKPEAT